MTQVQPYYSNQSNYYSEARGYPQSTHYTPLPEHWEMKMDFSTGWPFFIDHLNRRTTWDDPRYTYKNPYGHDPYLNPDPYYSGYPFGAKMSSPFNDAFYYDPWSHYPVRRATKTSPPTKPSVTPKNASGLKPVGSSNSPAQSTTTLSTMHDDNINTPNNSTKVKENNIKRNDSSAMEEEAPQDEIKQEEKSNDVNDDVAVATDTNSMETMESESNVNEEDKIESEPNEEDSEKSQEETQISQEFIERKIKEINDISNQATALKDRIVNFNNTKTSKEYLYLDGTLVSFLLKLDCIDTNGNETIRSHRKEAIILIQDLLKELEDRLS